MDYSIYNHIVKNDDGTFILYNFLTGRGIALSEKDKAFFDECLYADDDHPTKRSMQESGFIVDYDEVAYLHTLAQNTTSTSSLELFICPTLDCNFACSYCFESARSGVMSESVQDQVVAFARRNLIRFGSKQLEVTWHGGEPLLCPEIIESLTKRLTSVCDELGVSYFAKALTNGWFFTQKMADRLERCKVHTVQITLDGPSPQTHDKTRHVKGGQGSFKQIMRNLQTVKTNMRITVRCNVNKENISEIQELRRIVQSLANQTGNLIRLSPHLMRLNPGCINPKSTENELLNPEELFDTVDFDLIVAQLAALRCIRRRCFSQRAASFVIDELGNLYKCLEDTGRTELSFGNVATFDILNHPGERADRMTTYLDSAWYNGEECRSCKIMPLCAGGCPKALMINGMRACSPLKYRMDEYVRAICSV